ncbi:MAG: 5-formyltetrahydrofolate cyclo-ligase [Sedimentisphaerales bacterium]|nr:5-formyltetrahydrofolate cyclo-ligase [Sedimentisphaerales bacterium]
MARWAEGALTDSVVSNQKKKARRQLSDLLADLGQAKLRRRSIIACEHLCATAEFHRASVVMMFLSLPDEIDTTVAMERAWEAGKQIVVPYAVRENGRMIPMALSNLECEMTLDGVGIRCPAQKEAVPPASIDLVVVPGLGFDGVGRRLGRGGGFYDRFLAEKLFNGISCGLALKEQVLPEVPATEQDMPVAMLVTDDGVRRFSS